MNEMSPPVTGRASVAVQVLRALARRGTKRIWGVPGGGSSLDLIAGAEAHGMRFVLARQETAAGIMALADAELTGAPGAVLTTKGPGVSNAANGLATAALERAPLVLLSDGFSAAQQEYVTHQFFDQCLATAAYCKSQGYARAEGDDAAAEVGALLDLAMAHPRGAVHLDLTSAASRRLAPDAPEPPAPAPAPLPDVAAVAALLAKAKRPVVLVGLEAADDAVAGPLRDLVARLGCPVLSTYKGKGAVPSEDPQHVGLFTGGTLEAACVGAADLIILAGLDPVELILQPWRYQTPAVELAARPFPVHYLTPAAGCYGALDAALSALMPAARRSDWTAEEIAGHRAAMEAALAWRAEAPVGVAPPRIVTIAAEAAAAAGHDPRATVDAGAHMFSATAFWPCRRPHDLLISNGLATMGFALPAGIAAALHDPGRGAIAFTGDGGLMMCLAELATAAEAGARVGTVVFNDGALSLIDIKQQQRQLPPDGVRWGHADFAAIAAGMGVKGLRAADEAGLRDALAQAFAHDGPSLVDVRVDPAGYGAQLQAMRG